MIHIRRAAAADAALIADISRQTFFDTFAAHNTKTDMEKFLSEQFSKAQLIAEVNDPANIFLLGLQRHLPAGYVFLKKGTHPDLPKKKQIEISRLYVQQDFIGQGIGKALMLAAIDEARKQGSHWLWLGVWEHNQRAIQFYRGFGFQKFAEQDFLLGDDVQRDWVMKVDVR